MPTSICGDISGGRTLLKKLLQTTCAVFFRRVRLPGETLGKDFARTGADITKAFAYQNLQAHALLVIAREMHVMESLAGQLVTVFSFTYGLGAPVLAAIAGRWSRNRVLLGALAAFSLFNLASALAPNFSLLLLTRVLVGCSAALFGPLAYTVGASLAPPEKRGRALALGRKRVDNCDGAGFASGQLGRRELWLAGLFWHGCLAGRYRFCCLASRWLAQSGANVCALPANSPGAHQRTTSLAGIGSRTRVESWHLHDLYVYCAAAPA